MIQPILPHSAEPEAPISRRQRLGIHYSKQLRLMLWFRDQDEILQRLCKCPRSPVHGYIAKARRRLRCLGYDQIANANALEDIPRTPTCAWLDSCHSTPPAASPTSGECSAKSPSHPVKEPAEAPLPDCQACDGVGSESSDSFYDKPWSLALDDQEESATAFPQPPSAASAEQAQRVEAHKKE